ncbi:hypothetical protein LZT22_05485 [Polynucleobacter sp. IMCC 29146]|nr:hypothetical protein [Polynucleobacter sp. IMCC 29146]
MPHFLKSFMILVVIGVSSNGFAQSRFEDSFTQMGVGYEVLKFSFTGGTITEPPLQGVPYTASAPNSNNLTFSAATGYSFLLHPNFLLGFGAEYNLVDSKSSTYTITVPGGSGSDQFKQGSATNWVSAIKNQDYSVYVAPGYPIGLDKLVFAKLGYASTRMYSGGGDYDMVRGPLVGLGYKQVIADFDWIIKGYIYGFGEANYIKYSNVYTSGGTGSYSATAANVRVGLGFLWK